MIKIIFSEKENENFNGTCQRRDRNYPEEIVIYKNTDNKLRTLIHELIHYTLVKEKNNGSMMCGHLNNNENLVSKIATNIEMGVRENLREIITGSDLNLIELKGGKNKWKQV